MTCISTKRQRHCWLIPRSRTTRTGVIRSEPTRTGCCGSWCIQRPVVSQMTSVLAYIHYIHKTIKMMTNRTTITIAVLSWSLCDRIQPETTSIHSEIRLCSSVHDVGEQNPQNWMSSAQWCGYRPRSSINNCKSAMCKRKRMGPRTEPCGTRWRSEMKTWLEYEHAAVGQPSTTRTSV